MSGEGEDEGEKQYEASQKKLDDARKKGEVAKSTDLTTAAVYGGILLVALSFGSTSMVGLGNILSEILGNADNFAGKLFAGSPTPFLSGLLFQVLINVAPWLGVPAVFAILSVVVQQGLVFAPTKLTPKLSKISPMSGMKNKFGRQGLFEFFKSLTKLLIYCVILGVFLNSKMNRIIGSMTLSPGMIAVELGQLVVSLMLIVLAVAAILGVIDLMWQRAEHQRKHRMSRKELTDETKQSEGDPMLKQQRRQKGIEIAMNKMLAEVPGADVIIVNPTHYAVALKWNKLSGMAPICVAKGVDEIAAKIRELAMENAIPIHADPPTARALHAGVDIGHEIQQEHYQAVAAAIRFAERIRAKVVRN